MSKTFLIALLLAPSISLAAFDRNLYYGLQGDRDVTRLQEFLTEQGLYSGPVTGNFFSLTLRAVKAFQTANLITPTSGYFGPLTRVRANDVLASQGVLGSYITTESGTTEVVTVPPNKSLEDIIVAQERQIALLQSQIAELQKLVQEQVVQGQTLKQIQTQTMPKTPPPPPPVVDKSEVLARAEGPFGIGGNNMPYGVYHLYASVLDASGKYAKGVAVSHNAPDNFHTTEADAGPRTTDDFGSVNWAYVPTSPSTKAITFSSGGLSKTISLDVKP